MNRWTACIAMLILASCSSGGAASTSTTSTTMPDLSEGAKNRLLTTCIATKQSQEDDPGSCASLVDTLSASVRVGFIPAERVSCLLAEYLRTNPPPTSLYRTNDGRAIYGTTTTLTAGEIFAKCGGHLPTTTTRLPS